MKRVSIAEQTLKKQVKLIEKDVDQLNLSIDELLSQRRILKELKDRLNSEIGSLETARLSASKARKP